MRTSLVTKCCRRWGCRSSRRSQDGNICRICCNSASSTNLPRWQVPWVGSLNLESRLLKRFSFDFWTYSTLNESYLLLGKHEDLKWISAQNYTRFIQCWISGIVVEVLLVAWQLLLQVPFFGLFKFIYIPCGRRSSMRWENKMSNKSKTNSGPILCQGQECNSDWWRFHWS